MRKTPIVAVLLLTLGAPLAAAPYISPTDEALAVMMSSQEGVTSYLMRRFGMFTNTLTFNSAFTATTFQFSLVPGSQFEGVSLELSATGTRTALGAWSVTGAGDYMNPIDFSLFELHTWDPPLIWDPPVSPQPTPRGHDWDGASGEWDWHGHKEWNENPLDPGELISSGYIVYSKNGTFVDIRPTETDFRRIFIDDDGTWHTMLIGNFEAAGNAIVVADGTFGANGIGMFTVGATAVPEPSSGFLAALGGVLLAIGVWRRRKSPK